jgi:plasmid stabilization system protein ParE
MSYEVVLHGRVEQQLEESARWWAENRSAKQAEEWFAGFVHAIMSLRNNPERFALAAENQEFPFEVRELHYGMGKKTTHRALFTIRPNMVYVFVIRHVSQDEVDPDNLD